MKLQLTIIVEYKPNLVPEYVLRNLLERCAISLHGNGELTGLTDAEVENWGWKTHRLEDDDTECEHQLQYAAPYMLAALKYALESEDGSTLRDGGSILGHDVRQAIIEAIALTEPTKETR